MAISDGYIAIEERAMASYSIAEAKNRLPQLVAAAERGEQVVITRRGKTVAEIKPKADAPKRVTPEAMDKLRERLAHLPPIDYSAVEIVRQIRSRSSEVEPE
jgi:prevent-host-death family protein